MVHEVARYYWRGNAAWVNEGVPDLLLRIVDGSIEAFPKRYFWCPYTQRISDLRNIDPKSAGEQYDCYSSLGEGLFRELYHNLGDEFLEGLRRLYRKSQVDDDKDACRGTSLQACHIEAAFKEGASDEAIAAVDEAFDFWYEERDP